MNAYPSFVNVASLMGDATRAAMLDALLDGRALPASELAYIARVSPQTASAHLAKLVEGNLLIMETHGRHRYYKLANSQVAHALEVLSTLSPPVKVRSLRQSDQLKVLRYARTCYDHLAGQVSVELTNRLLALGFLREQEKEYQVTEEGKAWFERMGIEWQEQKQSRRVFARKCLDWSERHYHLAGTLGANITKRLVALGWITRHPTSRAILITEEGRRQFQSELGMSVQEKG